MGTVYNKGSANQKTEFVMFAINGTFGISAYKGRSMTYTNGATIVIADVGANNAQSSYRLIGDDFSGIVYNNGVTSNITVKKAGTYEINNNGNITTRKFNANDTFTLPNAPYSIRKIK